MGNNKYNQEKEKDEKITIFHKNYHAENFKNDDLINNDNTILS